MKPMTPVRDLMTRGVQEPPLATGAPGGRRLGEAR